MNTRDVEWSEANTNIKLPQRKNSQYPVYKLSVWTRAHRRAAKLRKQKKCFYKVFQLNKYPRNFTRSILDKVLMEGGVPVHQNLSELVARLLKPQRVTIAHRPT